MGQGLQTARTALRPWLLKRLRQGERRTGNVKGISKPEGRNATSAFTQLWTGDVEYYFVKQLSLAMLNKYACNSPDLFGCLTEQHVPLAPSMFFGSQERRHAAFRRPAANCHYEVYPRLINFTDKLVGCLPQQPSGFP